MIDHRAVERTGPLICNRLSGRREVTGGLWCSVGGVGGWRAAENGVVGSEVIIGLLFGRGRRSRTGFRGLVRPGCEQSGTQSCGPAEGGKLGWEDWAHHDDLYRGVFNALWLPWFCSR